MAGTAGRTANRCAPMAFNHLERRVLYQADRGPGVLRSFVLRTHMIYQLDVSLTGEWVEQVRQYNADCRRMTTASAP